MNLHPPSSVSSRTAFPSRRSRPGFRPAARRLHALLLAGLAVAAFAGSPRAENGPIRLAWSNVRGLGGTAERTFACDTLGGTDSIVLAFTAPDSLSRFVAMDVVLDVSTTAERLPPWWEFKNSGACRPLSLSLNLRRSSLPDSGRACADPWDDASNGLGVITGYGVKFNGDPRLAEASIALARPISKPTALEAGKVYFACTLVIDHRRTIGEYACAGCDVPVRIKVKSVKLYEPDGRTFRLDPDTDSCISWQGATCAAPTKITEPPGK